MVNQIARAKNLGEPFMAHLENLYNIPWFIKGMLCKAVWLYSHVDPKIRNYLKINLIPANCIIQ